MEEFFREVAILGAGVSGAVQLIKAYFNLESKILFKIGDKPVTYSFLITIILSIIAGVIGHFTQWGIFNESTVFNSVWLSFNVLLISLGVYEALLRNKNKTNEN